MTRYILKPPDNCNYQLTTQRANFSHSLASSCQYPVRTRTGSRDFSGTGSSLCCSGTKWFLKRSDHPVGDNPVLVKAPKGVVRKYEHDYLKFRFILEKQSGLNVGKCCNFFFTFLWSCNVILIYYFLIYFGRWSELFNNHKQALNYKKLRTLVLSDQYGVLKIDNQQMFNGLKTVLKTFFSRDTGCPTVLGCTLKKRESWMICGAGKDLLLARGGPPSSFFLVLPIEILAKNKSPPLTPTPIRIWSAPLSHLPPRTPLLLRRSSSPVVLRFRSQHQSLSDLQHWTPLSPTEEHVAAQTGTVRVRACNVQRWAAYCVNARVITRVAGYFWYLLISSVGIFFWLSWLLSAFLPVA